MRTYYLFLIFYLTIGLKLERLAGNNFILPSKYYWIHFFTFSVNVTLIIIFIKILLFCIILFCNSAFAETDSACTRTAGGAIIANALSPGSDDAAIVTDIGGETGSSCKEVPDFYKINFCIPMRRILNFCIINTNSPFFIKVFIGDIKFNIFF